MQQELIQHPVDIDYSVMKDFNDERFNGDNYYTCTRRTLTGTRQQ